MSPSERFRGSNLAITSCFAALALVACANSGAIGDDAGTTTGTGGSPSGTGGETGTGGTSATGGKGGSTGTGGGLATGGVTGTGGTAGHATGGGTGTGGTAGHATGGGTGTGGTAGRATGGQVGTGGAAGALTSGTGGSATGGLIGGGGYFFLGHDDDPRERLHAARGVRAISSSASSGRRRRRATPRSPPPGTSSSTPRTRTPSSTPGRGTGEAYVEDIADNAVRSEGQSYGMMTALQLNHQTEFDELWTFVKNHMWKSGNTIAWQTSTSGSVTGSGGAPDGDEWFAAALVFAAQPLGRHLRQVQLRHRGPEDARPGPDDRLQLDPAPGPLLHRHRRERHRRFVHAAGLLSNVGLLRHRQRGLLEQGADDDARLAADGGRHRPATSATSLRSPVRRRTPAATTNCAPSRTS